MNVSVREIHFLSEPGSAYFLRVDWSGRGLASGFQLLLTDGREAWRGDVSSAAVCVEAAELEMPLQRYLGDLQEALTETSGNFSFSVRPEPPRNHGNVTLTYEKQQGDISFRLGSVVLEAVEPLEAVRQLLVHGLQRGNELQQHNRKLEEENRRLNQEQRRITAELQRYAGGKEKLEAELFSRFVLVLNEKKAKIRSLQEAVTHLQESCRQKKEDSAKSHPTASPEEDEYGGSTDEEPEVQPISASTSLNRGSLLDDLTDVAPCRKRRHRHLEAPEKKTPRNPPKKRIDPPLELRPPPSEASAEDLFEDF